MLFHKFALPAVAAALAIHPREEISSCSSPVVRQEWRSLKAADRNAYIDAIHCLASKPSILGLNTTRLDDFAYVHNAIRIDIHFVASFLPWHRYFLHTYEQALKDCGYGGVAAYWDWTLDSTDPASSSIWDANTGLGGDGSPNKTEVVGLSTMRCVVDGPFNNLRPSYMSDSFAPHCLSRSFNDGTEKPGKMLGINYSPESVATIHALSNYNEFRQQLESIPHGAIHASTGGDMSPPTAPNDPLFFLHHAQVDRLWYLWQQEDPEKRTFEFGGIRTKDKKDGVTPPPAALEDIMRMNGLAKDIPIRDIMSTQSNLLCYTY
ncbi:hypothetical protein EKO04_005173 [Ascochyta lentis]|uniref:Tyrosinase copper-binding domain-containing protein n=1 Tax=Ascochyta lentis TaxID=205686 RepID=A0A8H7MDL2_9PLEO|nr:hypothetical protein EKO04_005173 [Ascochyta lentis]